jgi:mannose-6-phosphate isomerase-like protein (cupin superfamily)
MAKRINYSSILCKKYKIMKFLPGKVAKLTRFVFCALAYVTLVNAAQVADLYTSTELGKVQVELARKGGRFAARDLEKYGNHYTMLAYRAATGSSEIHEHEIDIFFITAGEASIVTGGRMIGGHATKPGELRGSSIDGGIKRLLKTGDVIHIPAGVPHQMLITPGKSITYFVVKVSGK